MPAGIYLHIPFCKSRCSYCDFATDVYKNNEAVERYVAALCREIGVYDKTTNTYADTVYFGGGTPSLLKPEQLKKILNAIYDRFTIHSKAEVTMEMNPATVTAESLSAYLALGVNRASFGVQTFDDRSLRLLGRGHDADDARQTFKLLRDAGFENISFDLIAGLPGQTLAGWEANLDEALMLSPEHLSLYLLEIHEGTPLAIQVESERQPKPDEELAAEMYEMMLDKLATAGYQQYEISNFSRSGYESRHNSKYWTLDPVYAFGVSGHSFDGQQRYANERDTAKYIELIERGGNAVVDRTPLGEKQLSGEFAFLNLRLTNGLDLQAFRDRFGYDLKEKYAGDLEPLFNAGLLLCDDGRLRLTRKGMLYSNEVFSIFV